MCATGGPCNADGEVSCDDLRAIYDAGAADLARTLLLGLRTADRVSSMSPQVIRRAIELCERAVAAAEVKP
jgi:hypothetical protein